MDPDVQVTFVTTTGSDIRADWSEQAETNLLTALQAQLQSTGERITVFTPPAEQNDDLQQTLLLNEAVTSAMAAHVAPIAGTLIVPLPHQATQPETYSLGDSVQRIAPESDAEYALFLTSKTRIESGGVFLTAVLIGAATGYVPVSTNVRGAFVSVVDMHTGEVVWLNGNLLGDPRNPTEAQNTISAILDHGPFAPPAP